MTREKYGAAYINGFPMTVRFLLSRGASRDSADENAQGAWAFGWERLAQLRNDHFVCTWVNAIAWNMYRIQLRDQPSSFEELATHLKCIPDFTSRMGFERLLQMADPKDRPLLREVYLHGVTVQEIANRVGITDIGIRVRLLRARVIIRNRLTSQPKKPRVAQTPVPHLLPYRQIANKICWQFGMAEYKELRGLSADSSARLAAVLALYRVSASYKEIAALLDMTESNVKLAVIQAENEATRYKSFRHKIAIAIRPVQDSIS